MFKANAQICPLPGQIRRKPTLAYGHHDSQKFAKALMMFGAQVETR
jgi:hypothetical protein